LCEILDYLNIKQSKLRQLNLIILQKAKKTLKFTPPDDLRLKLEAI